jgi:hypothetical protein
VLVALENTVWHSTPLNDQFTLDLVALEG